MEKGDKILTLEGYYGQKIKYPLNPGLRGTIVEIDEYKKSCSVKIFERDKVWMAWIEWEYLTLMNKN